MWRALFWISSVLAHELCLDYTDPRPVLDYREQLGVCTFLGFEKSCCDQSRVALIAEMYQNLTFSGNNSQSCQLGFLALLCAKCHPESAHLFSSPNHWVPLLCSDSCPGFYDSCSGVEIHWEGRDVASVPFPFVNAYFQLSDAFGSSESFCSEYAANYSSASSGYCYVPGPRNSSSGSQDPEGSDAPSQDFVVQTASKAICLTKVMSSPDSAIVIELLQYPGAKDRFLVVLHDGVVLDTTKVLEGQDEDGKFELVSTSVFLNISDIVDLPEPTSEKGMLGFAFHPRFEENGRFFVSFSCPSSVCTVPCGEGYYGCFPGAAEIKCSDGLCSGHEHVSVIAEYSVVNGSVDRSSYREILKMAQPFANHNGGGIMFNHSQDSKDSALLFIFFGDGGAGNDPFRLAQNDTNWFGKVLRIDIDSFNSSGLGFGAPLDNFNFSPDSAPGIYAKGMRNPWRCSIDRLEPSLLYCGDVGQEKVEEVDLIVNGGNYGWRKYEGSLEHIIEDEPIPDRIAPIFEIHRNESTTYFAVIGGYVYRSPRVPEYNGTYIFGDWNGAILQASRHSDPLVQLPIKIEDEEDELGAIYSFAEDPSGDVYILASTGVYMITDPESCAD